MHPFSGHRVFQGTALQTGEQLNFVLGCFDRESPGDPPSGASGDVCDSGPGFGEDSLVEGDDLVSWLRPTLAKPRPTLAKPTLAILI